ncbi:translation initiation factor eIF4A [Mortierella alpina]|nr:translation initiation factor eIF4A [Mortierella alpina]
MKQLESTLRYMDRQSPDSSQPGFEIQSNSDEVIRTFDSMGLAAALISNLHSYGIEKPSAIQQRSIPAILSGRDVLIQDPSLSGKTLACCISAIQNVVHFGSKSQILIMVPTREMAPPVQVIVRELCYAMDIHSYAVGTAKTVREDMEYIAERKPRVLVGTPGRLYDAHLREALSIEEEVRILIVDEVDEILSRGFGDCVGALLASLRSGTQVVLVLRAMTPEVADLMAKLRTDLVQIVASPRIAESTA